MADHNKLIIPSKITVGFQSREDTYTGQLAYVVYTDTKGVLRKEKSWQQWRDKKIEPKEFDNVPTSGFVLNKKVGDYGGGWNSRHAWIRIYDPRDFEFEISVANLLFILQETSAIKGKGLEGEFVYFWDGTELVLLPANSNEYQSSTQFTELQTKKITAKEMVPGCVYVNKDTEHVMYLGRHNYYELRHIYGRGHDYRYRKFLQCTKTHVFVSVDGQSRYWTQNGFTKLAAKISEEPSPLFADEFDKFKKSQYGSEPSTLVGKPYKLDTQKSYFYSAQCYTKQGDKYYPVEVRKTYDYSYSPSGNPTDRREVFYLAKAHDPVSMTPEKEVIITSLAYDHSARQPTLSQQEIENMEFYTLHIQNEQGSLIQI